MPHAIEDVSDRWRAVLTNAYARRVDSVALETLLQDLTTQGRPASKDLVDVVLGFRKGDICDRDPLVARYVDLLLRNNLISPSSLLLGLLHNINFSRDLSQDALRITPLPTFEEKVFSLLRATISNKLQPELLWRIQPLVFAITRWLSAVTEHEISQQLELGPLHTLSGRTISMYEALGLLAYTVFGHEHFRDVEKQPWWKDRRSTIAQEIVRYDVNVLQWSHSQISGHLQNLTATRPFLELNNLGVPIITREMILSEPQNIPITQSRGGLFIWMSALLHARPWTDDSTIRNYLLVRYLDDAQNATLSLIVATFDVLVNSTPGQGTPEIQKKVQAFITNRLPIILSSLVTAMPAGSMDSCISMALISIDLGPVTPLGTTSAEAREIVKKAKLEFLQSCVLHGLLNQATAASIVPDQAFTAYKHSRLLKSSLLSQCVANVTRLEALSQEGENLNGNLVAVSGCIAEVLTTLCANRDTMTLKSACSILLKRVTIMETVFQCVAPAVVLHPLCQVLNEWNHDQDQTEFQPPYEEFAVILLFLAAVVHSLDLCRADLGPQDPDDSSRASAKRIFTAKSSGSCGPRSARQRSRLCTTAARKSNITANSS